MADHRGRRPRRARLIADPKRTLLKGVLLLVTLALLVFILGATVSDIGHHGLSWLDVLALLVVLLFATGICGALWESLRGPRQR